MPSYSKRKGSDFEREAVKILERLVNKSRWKRVPTSGAIGTKMDLPILQADIIGDVEDFPRKFRVEAKCGYGGAKQFTLKKEWLDKVLIEASNTYSLPFLIGKFSGARGDSVFVVVSVEVFASLLNYITDLQRRVNEEAERLENTKG